MDASPDSVRRHAGYNLAAMTFTPRELADEIRKHMPSFKCTYVPDSRQRIADSWPGSIDDKEARRDWGWSPKVGLAEMTGDMLEKLSAKLMGRKAA
jgi:nucleoside-diphosphate-sugar epimerase